MEIFVETGAGKRITIVVQPSDTIKRVKDEIREEERLPPDEQYTLSLDGKLLEDGRTVSSYNMQNGATLFGASGIAYIATVIKL
jgi:ubiquitin